MGEGPTATHDVLAFSVLYGPFLQTNAVLSQKYPSFHHAFSGTQFNNFSRRSLSTYCKKFELDTKLPRNYYASPLHLVRHRRMKRRSEEFFLLVNGRTARAESVMERRSRRDRIR